MKKAYAFLAEGFEEVECLAVVDLLRRGGIDTILVSINSAIPVKGAHNIVINADTTFDKLGCVKADLLFLPGGMPGAKNLGEHQGLLGALREQAGEGKRIAAICAAPSVLGKSGLLKGKKATCYPGFEDQLIDANYVADGVVTDGNITTARGLGFAIDLGLELIKLLTDEKNALAIKESIQYPA